MNWYALTCRLLALQRGGWRRDVYGRSVHSTQPPCQHETSRTLHVYTIHNVMSCWFLYSRSVNEWQQLHDVLIVTLTTTWIVYVISGKTCSDYCKSVTQQSVWETVRNCYTTSLSRPRQHKLTTNRNSGVRALQSTFLGDQTTVTSAYFLAETTINNKKNCTATSESKGQLFHKSNRL